MPGLKIGQNSVNFGQNFQKIRQKRISRKNAVTTRKPHPITDLKQLLISHITRGHLVQSTNQCLKIAIFGQNWALFEIFGNREKLICQKMGLCSQNNDRKVQISC